MTVSARFNAVDGLRGVRFLQRSGRTFTDYTPGDSIPHIKPRVNAMHVPKSYYAGEIKSSLLNTHQTCMHASVTSLITYKKKK